MSSWQKVRLSPTEPVSRAIQLLDKNPLKIVLIVDNQNHLLGTVTDGDVRRGLIRHLNMDSAVCEFMRKEPRVGSESDSRATLLSIMNINGLLQVPILNIDGKVTGVETLQGLIEPVRYENPVFLMAGGFGKRLHPLTLDTPKPLLDVGGKPILQTIIESFISSGFRNFYISTHFKAEMLRNHFGNGDDWNVTIKYVHEDEPLGTAGALGLLPNDLPDVPIIMMNGDLLTMVNYESLLQYHEESGGLATMCVREYDFQVPYGVVSTREHTVLKITEKPIHEFFVNAGIYVLSPELYRSVDGKQYLDMPDLLQREIDAGCQVNMYPIHEYWLDIGRMEDYKDAQKVVF